MLWIVFNISWQQHITNKELNSNLPKDSDKVAARGLRLTGHFLRHPELPASSLILWEPTHGRKSQGLPAKIILDTLEEDIFMANTGELRALMQDQDDWRVHCCA